MRGSYKINAAGNRALVVTLEGVLAPASHTHNAAHDPGKTGQNVSASLNVVSRLSYKGFPVKSYCRKGWQ